MKKSKRFINAIIIICLLIGFVSADAYSITDNKEYVIRNVYEIINEGKSPALNLSIRVLAGAETDSMYQKLLDIHIVPAEFDMDIDEWGNIYVEINIQYLSPGESISIVIDKVIENSGITFDKSIYQKNIDYSEYLDNPFNHKYVLPGDKTESNAPEIKKKALELASIGTVMEKAKSIYDFVNLHITYDDSAKYANKGALSGLLTGRGVCDEYAHLFTALCRAAGIPSRVVAGYWIGDEKIDENKEYDIPADERHSWSEFFLPEIGWIPAEPTFLYTYNGRRMPNYDYFANIESDDRHFINNYIAKDIKKDLDVQYSHYGSADVNLILKSKESIKPLSEGYNSKAGINLLDIDNNWARDYIVTLYNSGIIFPKEYKMYKPDDYINRAEFAAFIVNALDRGIIQGQNKYKDVDAWHPLLDHIITATGLGLIQGYNGNFSPEDKITRQDIAVIMKRALDLLNINKDVYLPDFVDKDSISDYAVESVGLMYNSNIMIGKPGFIFAPKNFATRAEAAKIIYELSYILDKNKRP